MDNWLLWTVFVFLWFSLGWLVGKAFYYNRKTQENLEEITRILGRENRG